MVCYIIFIKIKLVIGMGFNYKLFSNIEIKNVFFIFLKDLNYYFFI